MKRGALVIALALGVAVAYMVARRASSSGQSIGGALFDVAGDLQDMTQDALVKVGGVVGAELWRAPAKYAPTIRAAEAKHGIPAGMLERLLYQESRYREDIITGKKRSAVGALGIAQFMPATAKELGIDPLNVAQAIDGAGLYLRRMYNMFGNWKEALAAYNWGPGNVRRKGLAVAPKETRDYYGSILADIGGAVYA